MIDDLRRSAAHVFVADVASPVLSPEDEHHLKNVLRLRAGEMVTCTDGRGRWRGCTWANGALEPSGAEHVVESIQPPLTVVVSPVKGDRTEFVVEKLVEIGIDRIVILAPVERSVVRWSPDKVDHVMERYRRVARAAAMQSRRVHLPDVIGPDPLSSWAVHGVGFAEPGGDRRPEEVQTLVVGPEGGFSDEEVSMAPELVDLGDTVLRAETAAIVGATRMVAHRARSVRHTG